MEPKAMSTGSDASALGRPPVPARFSQPRFPARWALESASAERNFARLLWLLVPLQYYVVTNLGHGLSADDLIPAVSITLISVVVIFFLSCIAAWFASWWSPPDPGKGDTLTGRVRMWVVALMICTAASYFLLALSLAVTHVAVSFGATIYYDVVTDRLMWLKRICGLCQKSIDSHYLGLPVLASLIYAFGALLMIALLYRAFRRGPASPPVPPEPGAISVGLIVAALMTFANSIATLD
jgi:hypothetical protein